MLASSDHHVIVTVLRLDYQPLYGKGACAPEIEPKKCFECISHSRLQTRVPLSAGRALARGHCAYHYAKPTGERSVEIPEEDGTTFSD